MEQSEDNDRLQIKEIDLIKCRLCQTNKGAVNLIASADLCQRIHKHLQIIITENGTNFPSTICTICDNILDTFSNFYQQCFHIDQQLRNILRVSGLKQEIPKPPIKPKLKRTIITSARKRDAKYIKIIKRDELESKSYKSTTVLVRSDDNRKENTPLPPGHTININTPSPPAECCDQIVTTPPTCTICERNFTSQILLEAHKCDNLRTQYSCSYPKCMKIWKTRSALKKHEATHSKIKKFLCTTCGKSFARLNGLKIHEKIHLEVKEYVCVVCSSSFTQSANLRTHIKKHHEGHRFYCAQCGKAYMTACSMKRHELSHTGVKDFKCEKCPSAFYTKKELVKHKRYHDGVRAYFCHICYKSFVEKHHLTVHARSHSGERPYICRVPNCTKSFTDSNKLKRHKLAVHRSKT